MLVPALNAILFMFVFLLFMHIASRISNRFFIGFIYNYYIICENLPYIRRCKLVSAIVVFYN